EEEDGRQAGAALDPAEGEAKAVEEEAPVREPGESVVQRLVDELLLGLLALGDVSSRDDPTPDAGVVEQVGDAALDPAPGPVAVLHPAGRQSGAARARALERRLQGGQILRVGELGPRA